MTEQQREDFPIIAYLLKHGTLAEARPYPTEPRAIKLGVNRRVAVWLDLLEPSRIHVWSDEKDEEFETKHDEIAALVFMFKTATRTTTGAAIEWLNSAYLQTGAAPKNAVKALDTYNKKMMRRNGGLKTKNVCVKVTREDIDEGVVGGGACPVARALGRLFPAYCPTVGRTYFLIENRIVGVRSREVTLPEKVQKFIREYDSLPSSNIEARQRLEPFQFRAKIVVRKTLSRR